MKFAIVALILLATGQAATLGGDNAMAKVVKLLEDMTTKITKTGESEQASYDKYACWCEETLAEKAEDITKAKDKMEELQTNIVKNKAVLGSGGATTGILKEDIAENMESQKEATSVRTKEGKEYEEERAESENCIGALEAAIKILTGAGAGKTKFLETLQEAKLMSIVGDMRPVLKARQTKKMSAKDLEVVEHFVSKPEDFVKHTHSSELQTAQNPFGDYAPQSTQIQGILKSMYDSFTSDLEKDNAEEAEKQQSFEELMATKKKELTTLQSQLQSNDKSFAEATDELAKDKAMLDTTKDQLASDEKFFVEAKESCGAKAKAWAQRSRLRTKELAGIAKAIEILDSDEAKKTFEGSRKNSFLQLAAVVHHKGDGVRRTEAYNKLRSLASSRHSLKLAQIAIAVKTRGHFDEIIVMIDKMIGSLREEEQEDISHRDRCEGKQNANTNSIDDAAHGKAKAQAEIERLEAAIKDKEAEIKEIEATIKETNEEKAKIKEEREKENGEYKQSLNDDEDAIKLLKEAKGELEVFYRDTKAALVQVAPAAAKPAAVAPAAAAVAPAAVKPAAVAPAKVAPVATKPAAVAPVAVPTKEAVKPTKVVAAPKTETAAKPAVKTVVAAKTEPAAAPAVKAVKAVAVEVPAVPKVAIQTQVVKAEPAPETNFQDGDYKGSSGEARGILSILDMIIEDVQKEIKTEGADELKANDAYLEQYRSLTQITRDADKSKTQAELEVSSLGSDKSDAEETKAAHQSDLDDENELKKSLATDCDWVKTHFDKRRDSRKAEIAGLNDAKDFLAGAGTDQDLSMP
jgi:hypothetical protein